MCQNESAKMNFYQTSNIIQGSLSGSSFWLSPYNYGVADRGSGTILYYFGALVKGYFDCLVSALRPSPFWYRLVENRSQKVVLSRCNDFLLFLDRIFIKYWWSLNWLGVCGDGEREKILIQIFERIRLKNKTTVIHHFWEPTQSTKISALNILIRL